MGSSVFPVGSRVQVVSYGPFRGLRGTIRTVDIIADDSEDPYCFYHIALDGSQAKQAIWFQCDEVELLAAPSLPSQETGRFQFLRNDDYLYPRKTLPQALPQTGRLKQGRKAVHHLPRRTIVLSEGK